MHKQKQKQQAPSTKQASSNHAIVSVHTISDYDEYQEWAPRYADAGNDEEFIRETVQK